MSENPKLTPYFFESEILSPFAALQPGEKYSFHYDWYCCRIASDLPVTDCGDVGVICEPLSVVLKDSSLNITGRFGVFYNGSLKISALDKKGKDIETLSSGIEVSPLKALDLNVKIDNVADSSKIKVISVVLLDKNNKLIGELAQDQISK